MRDLLDTALDTASGSNTGFLVYRLVNHGLLTMLACYSTRYACLLQPPETKKPDTWPGSIWWWAGSVHRHIASGHQVQRQAGHASLATPLPGGYAVGTAPMVTQGQPI